MKSKPNLRIVPIAHLLLLVAACSESGPAGGEVRAAGGEPSSDPAPFGTSDDVARAESLWEDLEGYGSWPAFPGLEGWQPGESPHGAHVRYFVDETVVASPSDPGDGAVIVKENFTDRREDALVAVTVMKKIQGYAPEHGDWFWVKYGPSGEVLADEEGTPLAGRVGAGSHGGCVGCHASAMGRDYVFAND